MKWDMNLIRLLLLETEGEDPLSFAVKSRSSALGDRFCN